MMTAQTTSGGEGQTPAAQESATEKLERLARERAEAQPRQRHVVPGGYWTGVRMRYGRLTKVVTSEVAS